MAFNSADTAAFKNVWVFCEQRQGKMMPTTFELISEGRKLADELGVRYWKNEGGALVGKASYHGHELLLVKPQSFMNLSGGPTSKLCKEYDCSVEELIVIHDELDIDPGTVKVKKGGGHAGHNGLKSIIEKCGSRDFLRVRTGIGRPPGRMSVVDFVLGTPKKDAKDDFDQACQRAAEAVESLLEKGLARTQDVFNRH